MIRLSRVLLVLFGIPTLLLIYFLFNDQLKEYSYLLLPLGVLIATTFVLQHQIDGWWIRRLNPSLDPKLKAILQSRVSGYSQIFSGKNYSEKDFIVFTHDCEYIGKGIETIPDDIKHLISCHAFYFGDASQSKWPKQYNRIVLYPHPFLSPQYEDQVHSVESHEKDGVLIFSMEQLISSINQPGKVYNIAIHGFAQAYFNLYTVHLSVDDMEIWRRLSENLSVSRTEIEAIVGLDDFDALIPLAHYYIFHSEHIRRIFPECQNLFDQINVE